MEKLSSQPSAPLPDVEFNQMPTAPPTYAQAMGHQNPPYPVQPQMPIPYVMPQQPVTGGQPNYVTGVPIQQQQQAPQQVTTTTVFLGSVPVGPKSVKTTCPNCQMHIKTSTVTENQASAHIACAILFILGCCLCSCIPYCMDSFQIVRHSCPNCKAYLGTYKP